MIPAHKNSINPPGQIVNKLEYPSKTMGQIVNDVTLTDYYERKMKEKMTFDEWWSHYAPNNLSLDDADSLKNAFSLCWKVAQENA